MGGARAQVLEEKTAWLWICLLYTSDVYKRQLQAIGVLNAHGKECGFCAQEPLMAAQEPDAFP